MIEPMSLDLELTDPEIEVQSVPAQDITWEKHGQTADVDYWLGNVATVDQGAIRLAAKQVAAEGQALRVKYPSRMPMIIGYDFSVKQWTLHVPDLEATQQEIKKLLTGYCQYSDAGAEALISDILDDDEPGHPVPTKGVRIVHHGDGVWAYNYTV